MDLTNQPIFGCKIANFAQLSKQQQEKTQHFITRFVIGCLCVIVRLWTRPTGSWSRVALISPKTWRRSWVYYRLNARRCCSVPRSPTPCRSLRISPWTSLSSGRASQSKNLLHCLVTEIFNTSAGRLCVGLEILRQKTHKTVTILCIKVCDYLCMYVFLNQSIPLEH